MILDGPTFELLERGAAIRCALCGRTSHNPHDVEHRYCGHCHLFLEVVAVARTLHRDGLTHDCSEWLTAAGVCAICGQRVRVEATP